MSDNPILDELYAARDRIWHECGESMDALCARYSKRRPGVLYADFKSVKLGRPRARPFSATRRKKTVAHP